MPSKQSTLLFAAVFLGSLFQGTVAAPSSRSTEFPTCIEQCIRSSGCFSDFDSCVCKKASDGILSDIARCMNQECPSTTTVSDLLQPLESSCKLPESAVSAAEKIGGVSSGGGDDEPTTTTSSKKHEPTTTTTMVISSAAVGAPVTAGGDTTMTTSTRAASMTIETDAATVSSLVVAQSTPPAPSPTSGSLSGSSDSDSDTDTDSDSSSSSNTDSDDNDESAASATSPISMLSVVAAIGAAIALL